MNNANIRMTGNTQRTLVSDDFNRADGPLGNGWIGPSWSIGGAKATNPLAVGADKFTNGPADGTYTAGLAVGWSISGTITPSEETTIVHTPGGKAQKAVTSTNGAQLRCTGLSVTSGHWYIFRGWIRLDSTTSLNLSCINGRGGISGIVSPTGGAFKLFTFIGQATATGTDGIRLATYDTNAHTIYADDFTFQELTLAANYSAYRLANFLNPRAAVCLNLAGYAGLEVKVDDPNNPLNFVRAYYKDGHLVLSKFLAGAETNLIDVTLVPANGEELEIRTNRTTFQLFYAGVQQGADQTITDAAIINNKFVGMYSFGSSTFNSFRVSDQAKLFPFSGLKGNFYSATYPAGKGVIAIRFDDSPLSDYTVVYPALQARGLVAGFAIIREVVDIYGTRISLANLLEMQAAGMELMCHTGGVDPADYAAFANATAENAENLRVLGLKADTFVQPGTWTGTGNHYNITSDDFYGTPEDLLLRDYFATYMAYSHNAGSSGAILPITSATRFGSSYYGSLVLADIESTIDALCASHKGMVIVFHSAKFDQADGATTADFLAALDYIKAKIDAGLLVNMTPTQLLFATPS